MFLFRLKRTIKLGAKSLWMHRLRSTLTTLGIIFGVCSVVAMLAIGEGASRHTQEQIARLGSSNIIIQTIKPPEQQNPTGESQSMQEYGLTYDDAQRFHNTIPDISVVVPLRRMTQTAAYRNRRIDVEIIGTVPWYPDITPLRVKAGRFLQSIDMEYRHGICVVDSQVYEQLFLFDDPIDQHIKLSGDYYRVIGVVGAETHITDDDLDPSFKDTGSTTGGVVGSIYIPLATVKNRFGETKIQLGGSGGVKGEKIELQQITVKVKSTQAVLPVRDLLDDLLQRFHKKKDYQIIVPLELLRQAARTKRIFSIVLGSIAAISLLVGGIGIMNIMLATVSERTREIGIRRALGARKRDIIIQFLSETVLLTVAGGALGILLGSAIPIIISHLGKMPTVITVYSLILAFAISAAVGVIFGIYPAYRAANMDPVEALRHQ